MPLSETDIIERYFAVAGLAGVAGKSPGVVLGIGDDCALLDVPPPAQLALSTDVLVEGVHFPATAPPQELAWRALTVNLSDLAAMGAEPLAFTLALTLPQADESWLAGFSAGLAECATRYGCPLVGGNLTRGPLQIAITVQGLVPPGARLGRHRARVGHNIYVSGEPGRAGLALESVLAGETLAPAYRDELLAAYYRPEPRLALGQALRKRAGAMLDVSDGLVMDLQRMARSSGVAISIDVAALPLARVLTALRPSEDVFRLVLTAGDDYELVFSAAPSRHKAVCAAARRCGVRVTRIGTVSAGEGVQVIDLTGQPMDVDMTGYSHFRAS